MASSPATTAMVPDGESAVQLEQEQCVARGKGTGREHTGRVYPSNHAWRSHLPTQVPPHTCVTPNCSACRHSSAPAPAHTVALLSAPHPHSACISITTSPTQPHISLHFCPHHGGASRHSDARRRELGRHATCPPLRALRRRVRLQLHHVVHLKVWTGKVWRGTKGE